MGDYRFCIKVKNVEITPINPNEIELDVKIDDKNFDDILMEIPEKEIVDHHQLLLHR